jgi:hypothetical protein
MRRIRWTSAGSGESGRERRFRSAGVVIIPSKMGEVMQSCPFLSRQVKVARGTISAARDVLGYGGRGLHIHDAYDHVDCSAEKRDADAEKRKELPGSHSFA